jgi:hypothetical protein
VRGWLAAHPRVTIHYTPTYNSRLNKVEFWFAEIERDCIACGIFTFDDRSTQTRAVHPPSQ